MRNSAHSAIMREAAACSQMKPKVRFVNLTCSQKVRASTGSARGKQWWRSEVFHIQRSGVTTLCGRDCSEWLRIGPCVVDRAISDRNCCSRCASRAAQESGEGK